ncbi:MAG: lipoyl(octanoyl) transferase LipB [Chlorobiota bacterium]|jgi:lipoyl(octanoyl) transferase|nr:lipoyl(octanoyl) transferase LipB [Chlorobiota bacterium]QQS65638.1 MAG: lipoyl(octanoyl) transferase LipB [Chlorobiota bacterium]
MNFRWLGRINYGEAYDLQKLTFQNVLDEKEDNTFFLCEHPDVITIGRNSKNDNNLLKSREQLKLDGYEVFDVDRGGDVTYHGIGQLVGYPIIRLKDYKEDLGWYLRSLEELIILTIKEFGVNGVRSEVNTGVWVNSIDNIQRKLCAIGIKSSRWTTMHGFALNVTTELNRFNPIVPCGIKEFGVTSIENETNKVFSLQQISDVCFDMWNDVFSIS